MLRKEGVCRNICGETTSFELQQVVPKAAEADSSSDFFCLIFIMKIDVP